MSFPVEIMLMREDGEVSLEVECRLSGSYVAADLVNPEEWPEAEPLSYRIWHEDTGYRTVDPEVDLTPEERGRVNTAIDEAILALVRRPGG